jgi:hypothetical protein
MKGGSSFKSCLERIGILLKSMIIKVCSDCSLQQRVIGVPSSDATCTFQQVLHEQRSC